MPMTNVQQSGSGLTAKSRVLLVFCSVHVAIMVGVWLYARLGLSYPWLRMLLVLAYVGNIVWLATNWWAVRQSPPAALVPGRVRQHLLLLRVARGLLMLALIVSLMVVLYTLLFTPHFSWATLLPVLVCPTVLAIKLRWLTTLQRRITRKAKHLAAA
jgi:hypothetical protein